jgi:SLOG family YspA-like protein
VTVWLVCGDRNWTDRAYLDGKLDEEAAGIEELTVVEGGARGADLLAATWARRRGHTVVEVRAEWNLYHRAAGPIRNERMLREHRPDRVIAFHPDLRQSKGTRDMVTRAWKAGVRVTVFPGE